MGPRGGEQNCDGKRGHPVSLGDLITTTREQAKNINKTFFPQYLRMVLWACLCEVVRVRTGVTLSVTLRYEDKRTHLGADWVLRGVEESLRIHGWCSYSRASTLWPPLNPRSLTHSHPQQNAYVCVCSQTEPEW